MSMTFSFFTHAYQRLRMEELELSGMRDVFSPVNPDYSPGSCSISSDSLQSLMKGMSWGRWILQIQHC